MIFVGKVIALSQMETKTPRKTSIKNPIKIEIGSNQTFLIISTEEI